MSLVYSSMYSHYSEIDERKIAILKYPVTAEEQTMINTAVLDVNSHITKLNATDAAVTPWTASLTHVRQHGGHYKHDYRQYPDGVHASRTLEKRIAKVMARGILGTLRNYNVLPPK